MSSGSAPQAVQATNQAEAQVNTRSAKNKGVRLQNEIVAAICARFPSLAPGIDVKGRTMGETGCDVLLSTPARVLFPFAVEARNQEAVNIWQAWEDAKRHAERERLNALAVIHRNRSDTLVVIDLATFLGVLRTDGTN